MDAADMLARDLVLRICASDTEFRRDWLSDGTGPKRIVPLAVPPGVDPDLARAIAGAAAEMGARHLLVCRTRAAFMYDTVTVLPATPHALLDLAARWGQPDDFLVCLPDSSAAVLVTMAGYALGAGAPAFLAALAGPDVAAARERFAAWARDAGEQRLRLVAARYGSAPSSRHAPPRRSRADLPERLWRLAASARRRPAAAAALRVGRAAVTWAALAVIVVTLLSAPRSGHVIPALVAAVLVVLEIFALSRTHTLGWPACLRMVAAGAVWAVALAAAEWLAVGTRALHPPAAVPAVAEELAKLVPIAVFWAAARHRFTRLAAVDYLLLGAASGAGFALAEGVASALAAPGAGWHVATLFPGWQDAGAVRYPGHAVTTGTVAAGIGLAVAAQAMGAGRARARRRPWPLLVWLLPPALLGLAVLDHYHYAAAAAGARVPGWVSRLHAAVGNGHAGRWLLLVLLAIAVVVDFHAARGAADTAPPLPGVPRWAGLARSARTLIITARVRRPAAARGGRPARWWAMACASAAEALAAAGHELVFLLVASRPRHGTRGLRAASMRFARQRRELATREAYASGRERRDMPPRAGVWASWRRITEVLALPPEPGPAPPPPPAVSAAAVALAALPVLAWAAALAGTVQAAGSASGAGGSTQAAVAAHSLQAGPAGLSQQRLTVLVAEIPALHTWFSQFIPAGQVLIIGAAVSVVVLLASGWTIPVPLRRTERESSADRFLRMAAHVPAPGQSAVALLAMAGWLLPPATARLLAGKPVARPYRRDPGARYAVLPSGLIRTVPDGTRGEGVLAAPGRAAPGEDLGRSGWMFPPDRVRRWLRHAPEFGVAATTAEGAQMDTAQLTDRFTAVLREIAESATSLRFSEVTFRNRPSRAVVDRASGAAVFFTPAGEFTGCAVLTEDQLFRLVIQARL